MSSEFLCGVSKAAREQDEMAGGVLGDGWHRRVRGKAAAEHRQTRMKRTRSVAETNGLKGLNSHAAVNGV
jgi:hypothetical protein